MTTLDLFMYDIINLNTNVCTNSFSSTNDSNINIFVESETASNALPATDGVVSDHDIVCIRCGRKLTDYQSKQLGMGPFCYKQYKREHSRQINLLVAENNK